jgi:AraC-like DNA-binding protein
MSSLTQPSNTATASLRLAEAILAFSRVTGLQICFHDYQIKSGLVSDLRIHAGSQCIKHKGDPKTWGAGSCFSFCGAGGKVNTELSKYPQGWIHQCPFGLYQIAVPLFSQGRLLGVLYGTLNRAQAKPSRKWLEDRREMLVALATQFGKSLQGLDKLPEATRRREIRSFLQAQVETPIELADLAKTLHLSPSRTRHVIKELFGLTFSQLLSQYRMEQAAMWLTRQDEISISDIALRLCFYDQSHFTRVFSQRFKLTPRGYRLKTRASY